MAKITLNDGSIFEGTIEELAELLEKVGGLNAANGDNFRKVEGREPRVGDYVKFFEDDLDITAGKYYEIIDDDGDGDFVFLDDVGDKQYAFLDNLGEDFEVFEKVGGEEPLKVGDYVVPLKSADDKYYVTNTEMKLGKVVEGEDDCCGDIRIEVIAHAHEYDWSVGEIFSVESKYFRKATQEEIDAALRPMLKVGDYAKIIDVIHSSLDVGDIVEIKSINLDDDVLPYKVKHIADGREWWISAKEIVKATDEEVAKAKWAKLGRKPGEFKKGDIVRVIAGFDEIRCGDIGVISDADGSDLPGVTVRDLQRYCKVELIAPVESRVDTE